jgi:hypothetical protein
VSGGRLGTAVVLALAVVLVGCARPDESAKPPEIPTFSSDAPAGGVRTVPKTCGEVATVEEISTILTRLVSGPVTPVLGVAQPSIGRTARLDCYYGGTGAAAPVWIALASYTDEKSAGARAQATAEEEQQAGAVVSAVHVGSGRGLLLTGKRFLVVAQREETTVVVSVAKTLVRRDFVDTFLGQLADLALSPREPAG